MSSSSLYKASVDPGRILSEARLVHSKSSKFTVIVEGEADLRFFNQWINHSAARLKHVKGKDSVKKIWRDAEQRKFGPLVCVADLDYDFIVGNPRVENERFLYISFSPTYGVDGNDCNDLESALIKSKALDKFLSQRLGIEIVSDGSRFDGSVEKIREGLRKSSAMLGACRAAEQFFYRTYQRSVLSDFRISDKIFDSERIDLSKNNLYENLLRSSNITTAHSENFLKKADEYLLNYGRGWGLCRGHDMCEMLAQHLTWVLPRRIGHLEVESGLREAFDSRMMEGVKFWDEVKLLQKRVNQQLFKLT